jgi:hypothetical protein
MIEIFASGGLAWCFVKCVAGLAGLNQDDLHTNLASSAIEKTASFLFEKLKGKSNLASLLAESLDKSVNSYLEKRPSAAGDIDQPAIDENVLWQLKTRLASELTAADSAVCKELMTAFLSGRWAELKSATQHLISRHLGHTSNEKLESVSATIAEIFVNEFKSRFESKNSDDREMQLIGFQAVLEDVEALARDVSANRDETRKYFQECGLSELLPRLDKLDRTLTEIKDRGSWPELRKSIVAELSLQLKLPKGAGALVPRKKAANVLFHPVCTEHTLFTAPACMGKTSIVSYIHATEPWSKIIAAIYICDEEDSSTFYAPDGAYSTKLQGYLLSSKMSYEDAARILESAFEAIEESATFQPQKRYVVIDGFDELGKEGDHQIVPIKDLIRGLSWPEWLQLIVTAQPIEELVKHEDWLLVQLDQPVPSPLIPLQGPLSELKKEQEQVANGIILNALEKEVGDIRLREQLASRIASYSHGDLLLVSALANSAVAYRRNNQALDQRDWEKWLERELTKKIPEIDEASGRECGYSSRWARYVRKKFNEEWFSPKREKEWELLLRLLALIVAQPEPQPFEFLARAAHDDSNYYTMSEKILTRMIYYLNVDTHELKTAKQITFRHASMIRWLRSDSDFKDKVIPELGNRYWSAFSLGLARNGLDSNEMRYIVRCGYRHLESQAELALESERIRDFEPLKALITVYGAVAAAAKRGKYKHEDHSIPLTLPQRYGDCFGLLDQYFEKERELTTEKLRSHARQIVDLVIAGADEIPALYAPLRVLADNGFAGSGVDPIKDLRKLIKSDQLLSRYAIGRAIADAYHEAEDDNTKECLRSLVEQAWAQRNDESDGYDWLDTASYCYRFLWSRGNPDGLGPWLQKTYHNNGPELCNHHYPSIRMAFGESLIERCCEPDERLAGKAPWKAAPLGNLDGFFYSPVWHYHCLDLAEAIGAWAHQTKRTYQQTLDEIPPDWRNAAHGQVISDLVKIVIDRLEQVDSDFSQLRSDPAVPDDLGEALNCYWKTERLMRKLNAVQLRKDGWSNPRNVYRWLRPFVYHPIWEVTEAASSILGDLREKEWGKETADAVIRKFGDEKHDKYWQAKYAAIDASYNSHGQDESITDSIFVELVSKNYNHSCHSRVQFICAEDSFLWYDDVKKAQDQSHPSSLARANCDKALEEWWNVFHGPLAYWLSEGNDSALLFEVYQWVCKVMPSQEDRQKGVKLPAIFGVKLEALLQQPVSPYLDVAPPNERWYLLQNKLDWLKSSDAAKRRAVNTANDIWPRDRPRVDGHHFDLIPKVDSQALKTLPDSNS